MSYSIGLACVPEPNLTRIETIVMKIRKRLGEQMALGLIHAQEEKQPVPGEEVSKV
jgi:hypothetical protein